MTSLFCSVQSALVLRQMWRQPWPRHQVTQRLVSVNPVHDSSVTDLLTRTSVGLDRTGFTRPPMSSKHESGSNPRLPLFPVLPTEGKKVILVVMHHTRQTDYATCRTTWSERFHNVSLDVPVLFHDSVPGLLTCEENTKTIDEIVDVLVKHSS